MAVFAVVATIAANAQLKPGATLGVRLGLGGEVSYQQPVAKNNRIEVDLGLYSNIIDVAGTYQWVYKLSGDFNWYLGAGAHLGMWHKDFSVGVAGVGGIEYNFPKVPIQLSIDYRPTFNLLGYTGFWGEGFGLGIRYRF